MAELAAGPATGRGLYLYGFMPVDCAGRLGQTEAPIVDLQPVVLHGVMALFREVSLEHWVGEQGEANLEDLEWIAPRAQAHQQVLSWALGFGPVLPVRFGVLFSSQQRLASVIATRRPEISDFLQHAAGHEEWGLKVLFEKSETESLDSTKPNDSPRPSGASYLRQRAEQRQAIRNSRERALAHRQQILGEVSRLAERSVELRTVTEQDDVELLANRALLLATDRVAELRNTVSSMQRRLGSAGLRLQLTGPWPPYSFCPTFGNEDHSTETGSGA